MAEGAQKDPFRCDQTNIYEQLGHDKFVKLSTLFYTRVYSSSNEGFREMFVNHNSMENAIQNQYEFFILRFGGPRLYLQRKGHPALRARHAKFAITREYADLWLSYMNEALDEVGIVGETKAMIYDFLEHTAYFLQTVDDNGERIYGYK